MNEIERALLGDKEAARRLTEKGVLLMQGDCLELLKDIPDGSVDMVLCDPPYGTTACKWDSIIPFETMWIAYKRILNPKGAAVIFGAEPFSTKLRMSNLSEFKYDWIWEKTRVLGFMNAKNKPMNDHEIISVFSAGTCANKSNARMIYNPQGLKEYNKKVNGEKRCSADKAGHRFARPCHKKEYIQKYTGYPKQILKFQSEPKPVHPTQKPVPLLEYLIRTYTNPGMTVLDNCMGSGSTGVACVNTGRKFIGMELDPGYFEVAKRRIEEAQAQARLAWNTRAPILSAEEMEMLEGME